MIDPSENFGRGINARIASVSVVTPSSMPPSELVSPVEEGAFQFDAFQEDAFQV